MDAIRADLFLGMLDGQFAGRTDDEIVAHVLAHPIAGETSEGAPADEEAAGTRTHGTEHGRDAARSADGAEGGRDAARSANGTEDGRDAARSAGGPTIEQNLDSACRHDHRLIHEGGWTTSRTGSGEISWTSGLGHTYVSRPPPVMMIYPDEDDRDAEPSA